MTHSKHVSALPEGRKVFGHQKVVFAAQALKLGACPQERSWPQPMFVLYNNGQHLYASSRPSNADCDYAQCTWPFYWLKYRVMQCRQIQYLPWFRHAQACSQKESVILRHHGHFNLSGCAPVSIELFGIPEGWIIRGQWHLQLTLLLGRMYFFYRFGDCVIAAYKNEEPPESVLLQW